MAEVTGERRYLALFRIGSETPRDRALTTMQTIAGLVDRWSGKEREAVFHADSGYFSAFLLSSSKPAGAMQAEFRNSPGIGSADAVLILEVGEDYGGAGFSRAWTWLQRRHGK